MPSKDYAKGKIKDSPNVVSVGAILFLYRIATILIVYTNIYSFKNHCGGLFIFQ